MKLVCVIPVKMNVINLLYRQLQIYIKERKEGEKERRKKERKRKKMK